MASMGAAEGGYGWQAIFAEVQQRRSRPSAGALTLRYLRQGKAQLDDLPVLGMVRHRMGSMCHSRWADFLRRILATGCAVLIFALGLFAASPTLHEQLHAGTPGSLDDGCAVVLFASGIAVSMPVIALPPVAGQWHELPAVSSREIFLDSPRYLLQPERGPPVG
jgi:hypothetical protein